LPKLCFSFSGWLNIGLTAHGEAQARAAGETIRAHGLHVDECYTSELCRASDTLALCLQAAGIDGHDGSPIPPTHASWKLNERHYGALTGLRKDDVKATLGSVALAKYRRDFDTPPMPMLPTHPLFSAVYSTLTARGGGAPGYVENAPELAALPVAESLSNCHDRVQAYVQEHVHPALRAGKTVLVAAHNNVLRTLMVHLDNADPRGEHGSADIPKAVPIVYQLDRTTMQVRKSSFSCVMLSKFACQLV
jgi:2,3-bisphosphoglycerate-dependent phosphoglycerate mutase